MRQFDFGENWEKFSANAATGEAAEQACTHFAELMRGIPLRKRTFLDIGFGQGFSLLAARSMGAIVAGCDINPKCVEVVRRNSALVPGVHDAEIPLQIGSILDDATVSALRVLHNDFDVVHSWGALHHTGDMKRAVRNAASLVRPGGHFVIAIYNRHWSSRPWAFIKNSYVHAPRAIQHVMVAVLYPVIWFAKLLVTGRNPRRMDRGMDFYYDVVDWIGGYPYECASVSEMEQLCRPLGLNLERSIPAKVPTGCNELIFRRHE